MVIKEHGWRELYRGLVPILIRNGPSNAVFFILREEAQKLPQKEGVLYENVHQFVCGAVIGAFTSSIFYPLNVVKVVIQSRIGGKYDNWLVVLKEIYVIRGRSIRNVYKGLNMNCIRAAISWGIIAASYENLRKVFY
jgi:Mitochondrial carrier protein